MALTTEGPRGASALGEMAVVTASIRLQPAVSRSRAAVLRAGVELAPVIAQRPDAATASAMASGNLSTNARPSARST